MSNEKKAEAIEIELAYMPLFQSTIEQLQKLSAEQTKELILALAGYYFDGEITTDFSDLAVDIIYSLEIKTLERSRRRYLASKQNAMKGGAPKYNTNNRKKPLTAEEFNELVSLEEQVLEAKNHNKNISQEIIDRYEELKNILVNFGKQDI
jgi:hypothetical protein